MSTYSQKWDRCAKLRDACHKEIDLFKRKWEKMSKICKKYRIGNDLIDEKRKQTIEGFAFSVSEFERLTREPDDEWADDTFAVWIYNDFLEMLDVHKKVVRECYASKAETFVRSGLNKRIGEPFIKMSAVKAERWFWTVCDYRAVIERVQCVMMNVVSKVEVVDMFSIEDIDASMKDTLEDFMKDVNVSTPEELEKFLQQSKPVKI